MALRSKEEILADVKESITADVGDVTQLPDYDEVALQALNDFDRRFSIESWKMEIGIIIQEQQCSFKEAVYEALVSNFLDKP